MTSATDRHDRDHVTIHGRRMAYAHAGRGAPIRFLHGNPTYSYIWRNIMPAVEPLGHCVAPDLIGMGDSDKLSDSGPGRYRYAEHEAYLFGLLDALDPGAPAVLVLHDWGAALGLAIWGFARRGRNPLGPILFLLIALIVVQGVWPLELQRSSFHWLPFRGFLEGSMLLNFLSLLTKLYFYGALVWLVHRLTRGSWLALVVPVAVTLFVEVAQTRVVGHTAEIADPLLCGLIWSVVRVLERRDGGVPGRRRGPAR